ncbi:AbrB/MazE/SpoVT family DNA-binding domain-containing protein [Colwellia sp. MEBiC06753]
MIVTIGKNGAIPLPDELSEESKLDIGDILLCTVMKDKRSIKLEKYDDQTLSDEQIQAHGLLTRVEALNPKEFDNL